MKQVLSIITILLSGAVHSQLPSCDIWLFELQKNRDGMKATDKPLRLNDHEGYNNQPSFSADSKTIYYVSAAGQQTELYKYHIKKRKKTRITITLESEFSPSERNEGTALNVVTVEADSSQRIYTLDAETGQLLKKLKPDSVGYFSFLNEDTLVFYKVGETHSLVWQNIHGDQEKLIVENPLRTFNAISRQQVVFGVKDNTGATYYIYDLSALRITMFARHRPGSENLFWHPAEGLLISHENKILRYDEKSATWQTLYDISKYGLDNISRFAIDPKGKFLVVVDNPI